jgi:hypothetical protein
MLSFGDNTLFIGIEMFESDASAFGYTIESIIGKNCFDTNAPED